MSLSGNHKRLVKSLSRRVNHEVTARFNYRDGVNLATGSKEPTFDELVLKPVIVHKGTLSRILSKVLKSETVEAITQYTVIVDRSLVPASLADPARRDVRMIYMGTEYRVADIRPLDNTCIIEYDLVRGGV